MHDIHTHSQALSASTGTKGNLALALGMAALLLLAVALLVTLIVTLETRAAPGEMPVAQERAQTVAPENDATYGLDLDKQTVARSKAILDEQEGATR